MNDWQLLRQLAYLIRSATWSASQPLFMPSSVVITSDFPDQLGGMLSLPACLLAPQDPQADPEHGQEPGLILQPVSVRVVASAPADAYGTSVLMGANRTSTTGTGRGVLEIAVPLLAALRRLNDASGVRIQSARKGGSGVVLVKDLGYVGYQELTLEAWITDARFFHPPTRFVATASGGGAVALSWTLPPDRFDFRRVILRRASGSTPPASATSGTGISLGGTPDGRSATSVNDTPGAGTFSYSLFAAYNDYSIDADTMADAPIADTTSAGDAEWSDAESKTLAVT